MISEHKLDVLLPLKAYFLGRRLRNHKNINGVLDIVKEAINRCGDNKDFYKRKAFYYLLECEITRKLDLDSSIKNRINIKKYCEERELTNFYANYMKIVDGNTRRKKILHKTMYPQRRGILGGYEPDFKNYPQREHDNFDDDNLNLHSLGFGHTELSEKDWNFIFKTTLKEIIDKHFE